MRSPLKDSKKKQNNVLFAINESLSDDKASFNNSEIFKEMM